MTRPWVARLRLPGAILLSLAVVAGGLALERRLGARALAPGEVPDEVSGAWFCPHGGGGRWSVWLVVANPGAEPAEIRVLTYGAERPVPQAVTVEAGAQRFVEVDASDPGAASAVEYFGGPVAAGMVVARATGGGAPAGRAAEPCHDEAAARWHLPEGSTVRGFGQRVVVMNPFAQEAVVSLWLTDERETIKPGDLQGIVLPARRSIGFDLGAFALGKETLAATVDVGLGKVAVAGIGLTERGLRVAAGVTGPSSVWVMPGGLDEEASSLTVLGTSRSEAPFRARIQGREGQLEVISEAAVPAGKATTHSVPAQGAGLLAHADGSEPFVAGRRLAAESDLASVTGAAEALSAWVALPTTPPSGGSSILILQNPGDQVADVRVSLLTETGPVNVSDLARVALRPGGYQAFDLESRVGSEPVSVLVEAEAGTVVAAQASKDAGGYAVALGAPFERR